MEFSENALSRARELHLAKKDIGRFEENRKVADSVKAQAEYELFSARNIVKNLSLQIEESNSKAKERKLELETKKMKKERHGNGRILPVWQSHNYQYAEVMKELEFVKWELSKLKLDMFSVLEAKTLADKEIEASVSRMKSYSSSVEALREEIDETNDEQVVVELARIEASKEFKAIEAQREAEAIQFSSTMEKTRKRIEDIIQEIDSAKELEKKLAITTSDIDVIQNELKLVKEMDERVQGNENLEHVEVIKRREEESKSLLLLESATEELEAAKKELECVREEGFRFMSSMDIIRDELKHVTEETTRLKKLEEKAEQTVKNLNKNLLRAKSKLEAASDSERKAKVIVSNLTVTLQQLQIEAEAAKKEIKLISEETASIQANIQKTESEIESAEEKLQAAMKELEDVKASELIALESLKIITEKTMRSRGSASQHKSTITISNFEYKYLSGCAERAKEIAEKKVAAARAWTEALKASEKEILMKTEIAHRETKKQMAVEEQELYRTEKSVMVKKAVEGQLNNWKQREKHIEAAANLQPELALLRKSMKGNGNSTPMRQGKPWRPNSTGVRLMSRSPSIALRKRKKVVPNFAKFFRSRRSEKYLQAA